MVSRFSFFSFEQTIARIVVSVVSIRNETFRKNRGGAYDEEGSDDFVDASPFACRCLWSPLAEEDDPIVIGQVFWGLHDSYQHAHQVQTQKYCDELGIEYIPIDGQMKPEVQAAGMEDLIARGVDGIICQAYDQASMELSIQAAQDAGIPVVSFVNVSSGDVLYPSVEMAEEAGAIEMGRIVGEKSRRTSPTPTSSWSPSAILRWNGRTISARWPLCAACRKCSQILSMCSTAASPIVRSPTPPWKTCCSAIPKST